MTQMISERDAVMRERAAFRRGYTTRPFELRYGGVGRMIEDRWEREALEAITCREYPLPKVKRPRVVKDVGYHGSDWSWTVEDGKLVLIVSYGRTDFLEYRKSAGDSNLNCTAFNPTAERVKLWADLLANPLEEVEAE